MISAFDINRTKSGDQVVKVITKERSYILYVPNAIRDQINHIDSFEITVYIQKGSTKRFQDRSGSAETTKSS